MIRKHQNPTVPGLSRDEPHPDASSARRPHEAAANGIDAIAPARPAHHSIARRAYEIYVGSGCVHGRCDDNWRQAERELAEEHALPIGEPVPDQPEHTHRLSAAHPARFGDRL